MKWVFLCFMSNSVLSLTLLLMKYLTSHPFMLRAYTQTYSFHLIKVVLWWLHTCIYDFLIYVILFSLSVSVLIHTSPCMFFSPCSWNNFVLAVCFVIHEDQSGPSVWSWFSDHQLEHDASSVGLKLKTVSLPPQ